MFWTFELSAEYERCLPKIVDGKVISFMRAPFNHLRFVTYCLLPFAAILVLNVLIVARLRWTPVTLKPGLIGSNPAFSLAALEASSVGPNQTTDGTTHGGSATRIANPSASVSAIASRQKQQV